LAGSGFLGSGLQEQLTKAGDAVTVIGRGPSVTRDGDPATRQLARLARSGLAGPVGGGNQWVAWIGIDNFLDLLVRTVKDASMSGLYHLTSPSPVRNSELMAAYRQAVGRRFGLPAPKAITTIGAWLLGSDPALALTGHRCVPTRLVEEGHDSRHRHRRGRLEGGEGDDLTTVCRSDSSATSIAGCSGAAVGRSESA
jgi:NAD dependent epimerase/dehydratase family enzyme